MAREAGNADRRAARDRIVCPRGPDLGPAQATQALHRCPKRLSAFVLVAYLLPPMPAATTRLLMTAFALMVLAAAAAAITLNWRRWEHGGHMDYANLYHAAAKEWPRWFPRKILNYCSG